MFYLLQEGETSTSLLVWVPQITFPVLVCFFFLLLCWSLKCYLLLFCLCCSINYFTLPHFISSEAGSSCSSSKQVFGTFVLFPFNGEMVFFADLKKNDRHMGFFACWMRDSSDPDGECKCKGLLALYLWLLSVTVCFLRLVPLFPQGEKCFFFTHSQVHWSPPQLACSESIFEREKANAILYCVY